MPHFILTLLFVSFSVLADCNLSFKNSSYAKFKLNKEYDLDFLSSTKSVADVKKYLKMKKINYRSVKFEGEQVIELTGKDSTQLSKLVRHAKKYDTRVFINPALQETGMLGYFSTNEDLQRFIFLTPSEVFIKSTKSYETVIHELRHARYDFLREIQVDSFYHGELHALTKNDTLMLKKHDFEAYESFQSIEELPLYIKDLHSEILSLRKSDKINLGNLGQLKRNTTAAIELHERVIKRMPKDLDKLSGIDAVTDGDLISISVEYKNANIVLYSLDQRLLDLDEIRLSKKNMNIIKEIVQMKFQRLRSQSKEIVTNLEQINKLITSIDLVKGQKESLRNLDDILNLNGKNLALIRE